MLMYNPQKPSTLGIVLLKENTQTYFSLYLFHYHYIDFAKSKRQFKSQFRKSEKGLTLLFKFNSPVDIYILQQEFMFVVFYFFGLKEPKPELIQLAKTNFTTDYPELDIPNLEKQEISKQIITVISPAFDSVTQEKITPNYFLEMRSRNALVDFKKIAPEYSVELDQAGR